MFLPKTYCVFAETIVRIAAAKKFFETLKSEGLTITFEKQMSRDDIVGMIERIVGR